MDVLEIPTTTAPMRGAAVPVPAGGQAGAFALALGGLLAVPGTVTGDAGATAQLVPGMAAAPSGIPAVPLAEGLVVAAGAPPAGVATGNPPAGTAAAPSVPQPMAGNGLPHVAEHAVEGPASQELPLGESAEAALLTPPDALEEKSAGEQASGPEAAPVVQPLPDIAAAPPAVPQPVAAASPVVPTSQPEPAQEETLAASPPPARSASATAPRRAAPSPSSAPGSASAGQEDELQEEVPVTPGTPSPQEGAKPEREVSARASRTIRAGRTEAPHGALQQGLLQDGGGASAGTKPANTALAPLGEAAEAASAGDIAPAAPKPGSNAPVQATQTAAEPFAAAQPVIPPAVTAMPAQPASPPEVEAPRFTPRLAPAQQVAPVAIALALGGGTDGRIALSLDPVELGRVEVTIERAGEAALVHVAAERPETLALLARDGAALDRALGGAGIGGDAGRSLSFSLLGGDAGGGAAQGGPGSGADPGGRRPGQGWRGQDAHAGPGEPGGDRRSLLGLLDIAI
ncbi:flagellar hook-length control protein FliK [Roseomonas sp. GCM10028921]